MAQTPILQVRTFNFDMLSPLTQCQAESMAHYWKKVLILNLSRCFANMEQNDAFIILDCG
jgi:hypothetical protein